MSKSKKTHQNVIFRGVLSVNKSASCPINWTFSDGQSADMDKKNGILNPGDTQSLNESIPATPGKSLYLALDNGDNMNLGFSEIVDSTVSIDSCSSNTGQLSIKGNKVVTTGPWPGTNVYDFYLKVPRNACDIQYYADSGELKTLKAGDTKVHIKYTDVKYPFRLVLSDGSQLGFNSILGVTLSANLCNGGTILGVNDPVVYVEKKSMTNNPWFWLFIILLLACLYWWYKNRETKPSTANLF